MKASMRNSLMMVAMLVLPLSTVQANLIVNPGFEMPAIGPGFQVFANIPGWALTSGHSIEIQNHAAGSPFDGNQLVELDSYANSGMTQLIATIPGMVYDLSFAYSPRPGVSVASNGIDVFFDGVAVDSLTASGIGLPDTSWSIFHYSVVASGASTAINFVATGISDQLGGYLDAVSLVQRVPEPTSVLLLGLSLAGLGFARKRLH